MPATSAAESDRPRAPARPPASSARRALRRFLRHRLGVAGLSFLVLATVAVALAPWVAPHDPERIDLAHTQEGPSAAHPLGTDENGRDVLSRLLFGGRVTLAVGVASMVVAILLGTALGAVGGYYGGVVDRLVTQFVDGMLAIPLFFLWLLILTSVGPRPLTIVITIGATGWMSVARVVRAEVMRLRELEFVQAARALGASPGRVLIRHVLPQVVPSVLVGASLATAFSILSESALSFLGIGIQPPAASWGNMLGTAQQYVWETPELAVFPGVMILLTVLSFNALGAALQSAFDVRG